MDEIKILIAEDDKNMRLSLDVCLRAAGFNVQAADDGSSALELLESAQPGEYGLLITDIVMKRMNGIRLIDEVRRRFPDLPKIVITGYNTRDTAAALKNRNCTAVLYKPFSEEALVDEIRKVFPAHPGRT